jgi:hypothetical protein
MKRIVLLAAVLGILSSAASAAPSAADTFRLRQWASAKFEGQAAVLPQRAGIVVLANNDPVQLNARAGKPVEPLNPACRSHQYAEIINANENNKCYPR